MVYNLLFRFYRKWGHLIYGLLNTFEKIKLKVKKCIYVLWTNQGKELHFGLEILSIWLPLAMSPIGTVFMYKKDATVQGVMSAKPSSGHRRSPTFCPFYGQNISNASQQFWQAQNLFQREYYHKIWIIHFFIVKNLKQFNKRKNCVITSEIYSTLQKSTRISCDVRHHILMLCPCSFVCKAA